VLPSGWTISGHSPSGPLVVTRTGRCIFVAVSATRARIAARASSRVAVSIGCDVPLIVTSPDPFANVRASILGNAGTSMLLMVVS
jgi:hypothetical protein